MRLIHPAPKPTSERLTLGMSDREYIRYSDGSLRRAVPKPKGRKAVKAAKRLRRKVR